MDSSKILPGSEECSSSESGWTAYIVSPDLDLDLEQDQADNKDGGDYGSIGHQGFKKEEEQAAANSDDSMASDASSGPSDQRYSYGYLARNKDKNKSLTKKLNQHEEKKKKKKPIKGEKDNSGSRGRLKKS